MSLSQIYVPDANVFIEAKNRYYAFSLAPGYWDYLELYAENKQIELVDRIKKQLDEKDDDLSKWISGSKITKALVSTAQEDVAKSYQEVIKWVQGNKQFEAAAVHSFAGDADAWLIAYAKAKSRILVTHETKEKLNAKARVPIPNVCKALNVPVRNTFEMLQELGAKLIK